MEPENTRPPSVKPLNRTEKVLQWLEATRDQNEFMLRMRASGSERDRDMIGSEALEMLYDDERLRAFVQWTMHPLSGFIGPDMKVKPLPDDVKATLEEYLANVNGDIRKLNEMQQKLHQPAEQKAQTISRREFIKDIAPSALLGAAVGAAIELPSKKPDESSKDKAKRVAGWALIDATAFSAIHIASRNATGTKYYQKSQHELYEPQPLMTLQELLNATNHALEKIYNHEQAQFKGRA